MCTSKHQSLNPTLFPSRPSEGELHQPRIQHKRQQKVERDHCTHRPDSRERRNLPVERDHGAQRADPSKHNHTRNHDDAKDKGELELGQDLGHLFKERRVLGLLARRAPRHVDAEHVARDGLADVDRHAAEEDGEQGQPSEVFDKGANEAAAFGAVA